MTELDKIIDRTNEIGLFLNSLSQNDKETLLFNLLKEQILKNKPTPSSNDMATIGKMIFTDDDTSIKLGIEKKDFEKWGITLKNYHPSL